MAANEEIEKWDLTKDEKDAFKELQEHTVRINAFKKCVDEYGGNLDTKIKKLSKIIDSEFKDIMTELELRKKILKDQLSNFQKHKKKEMDSEKINLTKYEKYLKQKNTKMTEIYKKHDKIGSPNHDKRAVEMLEIYEDETNKNYDKIFDVYTNQFNLVSYFQGILTRPYVRFDNIDVSKVGDIGKDVEKDDDTKVDDKIGADDNVKVERDFAMVGFVRQFGAVGESTIAQLTEYLKDALPSNYNEMKEIEKTLISKIDECRKIEEISRNSLGNMKAKDVNTLHAKKQVSQEIIWVFCCICLILNKEKIMRSFRNEKKAKNQWNLLKQMLTDAKFIPNIINFKKNELKTEIVSEINNSYLTYKGFNVSNIAKEDVFTSKLCQWVIVLIKLNKYNEQLTAVQNDLKNMTNKKK